MGFRGKWIEAAKIEHIQKISMEKAKTFKVKTSELTF